MRTWFTSDTHYGHVNIIPFCGRPISSLDEMREEMIERWNARVAPEDTVYHLGDFAIGHIDKWRDVPRRLCGRKILVKGNHDRSAGIMRSAGFEEVVSNVVVEIDGVRVWMNHFPRTPHDSRLHLRRPPAPAEYDLALCGHVHDKWRVQENTVNVGVDVWDFTPVTLEEIQKIDGCASFS